MFSPWNSGGGFWQQGRQPNPFGGLGALGQSGQQRPWGGGLFGQNPFGGGSMVQPQHWPMMPFGGPSGGMPMTGTLAAHAPQSMPFNGGTSAPMQPPTGTVAPQAPQPQAQPAWGAPMAGPMGTAPPSTPNWNVTGSPSASSAAGTQAAIANGLPRYQNAGLSRMGQSSPGASGFSG